MTSGASPQSRKWLLQPGTRFNEKTSSTPARLMTPCISVFPLFALAPLSVLAAPPTAFDNWSANGGTINAPCPNNHVCTDSVADQGILQRIVQAPNGEQYVQLIISGQDATGAQLSNESFVRLNSVQDGIAAKQVLISNGATNLTSQAILDIGWANTSGLQAVQLSQSLAESYQGVSFNMTFGYSADHDNNGNVIGSFTSVEQILIDSTRLTTITPNTRDEHRFVNRRATGTRVPNGGSVSLPAVGGGQMGGGMGTGMMGGGGGGSLTWNALDDVQVTWIGQLCQACGSDANAPDGGGGGGGGGMGGGGMGGGIYDATFSYQAFDNLVDAQDPIATASIASLNPFVWPNPPFGPAPTGIQ